MEARKLIYALMVCLPGILVGSIAVEARFRAKTYEWPESALAQPERVAAYGPIVRRTTHILASRRNPLAMAQVADDWITMAARGDLPTLCGSGAGDGIRVGLKSEVFATRRRMCIRLAAAATDAAKTDPTGAAQNVSRILLLGEIAKYCDFESVSISAEDQLEALPILRAVLPRLSGASQARMFGLIRELRNVQRPLGPLVMLSIETLGGRISTVDGQTVTVYGLASLFDLVAEGSSPPSALPMLSRLIEAAKDLRAKAYLRQIKRAIYSQLNLATELAQLTERSSADRSGILANR